MKSNLSHIFGIINNSDGDYQKKILKNFISDLFQCTLLEISNNRNRPDLDRSMYDYKEPSWRMIKTFECQANLTTVLKFNAIWSWEYNSVTEEYSELYVREIIAPRIEWMKMTIDLEDYFTKDEIAKAILHLANGIAVEEWKYKKYNPKGVPQP